MQLPNRKTIRAQRHDYASAGIYFVTICTQDRVHYFGKVQNGIMIYTDIGKVCDQDINNMPNHWWNLQICEYVIMPNHIHLLLSIGESNNTKPHLIDNLTKSIWPKFGSLWYMINLLKWWITKKSKKSGYIFWWHSRYHDHIVRSQQEYDNIQQYIIHNPVKRSDDKFYHE